MTVVNTSLQAFYDLGVKKIGERQQQVYEAVAELGMASNEIIARHTGLAINVVTPRVKELRDLGFLGLEKEDRNMYGRMVKFWSTREPVVDKQLRLIKEQDCEG